MKHLYIALYPKDVTKYLERLPIDYNFTIGKVYKDIAEGNYEHSKGIKSIKIRNDKEDTIGFCINSNLGILFTPYLGFYNRGYDKLKNLFK